LKREENQRYYPRLRYSRAQPMIDSDVVDFPRPRSLFLFSRPLKSLFLPRRYSGVRVTVIEHCHSNGRRIPYKILYAPAITLSRECLVLLDSRFSRH